MKNRQFDAVLEIIPHLCRFEGCQVYVKMNDDHEKSCGYRRTDCKVNWCDWNGCVTGLAEHVEGLHKTTRNTIFYAAFKNFMFCYPMIDSYFPCLAHEQVFWKHIKYEIPEKLLKISFSCLQVEKVIASFQITVTLSKDKKIYSTTILMLSENLTNEEENRIFLPFSLVEAFMRSDDVLSIKISIEKK